MMIRYLINLVRKDKIEKNKEFKKDIIKKLKKLK